MDPIDSMLRRWARETYRSDSTEGRREAYGECLSEGLRLVNWSKRIYAGVHLGFLADTWEKDFGYGETGARAEVHLECAAEIREIEEGQQ